MSLEINKVFFEQVGECPPADVLIGVAENPFIKKEVFRKLLIDGSAKLKYESTNGAASPRDSEQELKLRVAGMLAELGIGKNQTDLVLGIAEDQVIREISEHAW